MIASTQIEPFSAKNSDVSIFIDDLIFQLFDEIISADKERLTALTGLDFGMAGNTTVNVYQKGKEVVGRAILTFRNQGEDFSLCIYLIVSFSAASSVDTNGKSVCCKFTEYMFEWLRDYVKTNDIKDANGNPFIVPPFMYSPDRFTTIPE